MFETGTATNYKTLLEKLKDFATIANTVSDAVAGGGNTGNGDVINEAADNAAPTEVWTLTATSTGPSATFTVVGSVSGSQATATSGVAYDNGIVSFTITDGGTAWAISDSFTFNVTQKMGTWAWDINRWDTDWDGNGEYELMLKGPGSTQQDEIFCGIKTRSGAVNQVYNWQIGGFTGFISGEPWDNMPGVWNATSWYRQGPQICLDNDTLRYWFLGNGRRLTGVVKVDTCYEWFYMGFITPYGMPDSMAYPLLIGGDKPTYTTDAAEQRYSHTGNDHRPYWQATNDSPGTTVQYTTKIWIGGEWIYMQGRNEGGNWYHTNRFWPYCHGWTSYSGVEPFNDIAVYNDPNIDGSTTIWPLVAAIEDPTWNILGELDGVLWCQGGSQSSEDTFTIDGVTYIKFQACNFTDQSDFACLKLD
jgi:hypothetical protein